MQWTFDNTVCKEKDYPDFGDFLPKAVEILKALADKGHTLILWTCRIGDEAQRVLKHCVDAGIPFQGVNEGYYRDELHQYKKVFADVYIDNRNFGNEGKPVDWDTVGTNLLGIGYANILWKGKYIKVISPRQAPYEAVECGDSVIVFLVDEAKKLAFIRREHCPPYEYKTGTKHWYTVISGGKESSESALEAAIREVREEIGIDLNNEAFTFSQMYSGKFMKTVVDNVTVFLIKVSNPVIKKPEGDGTVYEQESSAVAVPYDEIELLKPCDFLLKAVWAMVKPVLQGRD